MSVSRQNELWWPCVNILIVEDEMLVATDLEATIEELGHTAIGIAADHDTALELSAFGVDLALVDLNLRDGETGPAVGRKLAAANIKVVFVTGNPRVIGSGVPGTLGVYTKPLNRDAIAALIEYVTRLESDSAFAPPPDGLRVFDPSA